MTISFDAIPNDLRTPFVAVEFNSERAIQGATAQPYQIMVFGQKLSTGTVAELTETIVSNESQAAQYFGQGSTLHMMLRKVFQIQSSLPVKAIAIDDAGAAVQATGSFAITGPATESGVLFLYIAGQQVQVGVSAADTADDIATAARAAINAEGLLPVTAAGTGADVDLTARNGGSVGNDIDLRINYFDSDALPSGVGVTVTAMSGGAGDPDVDEIIAVLSEEQHNLVIHHFNDTSNLNKLKIEMDDRAGPIRQVDGVAVTAKRDSFANLITFGDGRNGKYESILAALGPSPYYEFCAAYGARIAQAASIDPARPFQSLELTGILAPRSDEQFSQPERNNLLKDGIATHRIIAGAVQIERAITTYQTNAAGGDDTSFLDVNTPLTLSKMRYDFRQRFLQKFPRHKLADDGARVGPGSVTLTPRVAKAEAVALAAEWVEQGIMENIDQFKAELIVERRGVDRLDFILPPDLVNQARVFAAQIQFLL